MDQLLFKVNKDRHLSKNPIMRRVMERFNSDIIILSKKVQPKTILDAGCGQGFVTVALSKAFPKAKITAFDLGEDFVDYAKEHNARPNITYQQADLLKLPFEKESFDLVVCNEVLEHLDDFKKGMKSLCDASKKYILVSVPNEPWFRIANVLRFKYIKDLGNAPGHVNNWTASSFKALVKNYGSLVEFRTSSFWNMSLIEKKGKKLLT